MTEHDETRLAEIAGRVERATVGPWEAHWVETDFDTDPHWHVDQGGAPPLMAEAYEKHNAAFIAHARTDVPWLLERVAQLTRALADARDLHEKSMDTLHRFAGIKRDGLAGLIAWIEDAQADRRALTEARADAEANGEAAHTAACRLGLAEERLRLSLAAWESAGMQGRSAHDAVIELQRRAEVAERAVADMTGSDPRDVASGMEEVARAETRAEAAERSLAEARSELAALRDAAADSLADCAMHPGNAQRSKCASCRDGSDAVRRLRTTLASLSDAARARDEAIRAEGREQAAKVCDAREADQKRKARSPEPGVTTVGVAVLAGCAAEAGTCAARIRALRADKDGKR